MDIYGLHSGRNNPTRYIARSFVRNSSKKSTQKRSDITKQRLEGYKDIIEQKKRDNYEAYCEGVERSKRINRKTIIIATVFDLIISFIMAISVDVFIKAFFHTFMVLIIPMIIIVTCVFAKIKKNDP